MDCIMFSPGSGLYPWLATVAYILERPIREIEDDKARWKKHFDAGLTASAAITAETTH